MLRADSWTYWTLHIISRQVIGSDLASAKRIQCIKALSEAVLRILVAYIRKNLEMNGLFPLHCLVLTHTASSLTSGLAGSQRRRRRNLLLYRCSMSPRGTNCWAMVG